MSTLDTVIEDLKALSPATLRRVADYVHRLRTMPDQTRASIIERTSGVLTATEADELEQIIYDGCEQLDESE